MKLSYYDIFRLSCTLLSWLCFFGALYLTIKSNGIGLNIGTCTLIILTILLYCSTKKVLDMISNTNSNIES